MEENWLEDYEEEQEEEEFSFPIEYNITSSPNDFNIKTLNDLMEEGIIKIPSFQRNFVWDIKRASKLIESIIMGLPVPQIFFYEEDKNKFVVVDGQQRLMSIYYFMKKRFPRKEKRQELRAILDKEGEIPQSILLNNAYFEDFILKLPDPLPGRENRLHGADYDSLSTDDRRSFELRTIRSIIIRQYEPDPNKDKHSSMYEIFYRLNTGGINLKPQEIRTCLYHSEFYRRLYRMNLVPYWRKLINKPYPDIHMKDVEVILRGFAMLINGENYAPPMIKFLNKFSEDTKTFDKTKIDYLEKLFYTFLEKFGTLVFKSYITNKEKFNISLYEAIFYAACKEAYDKNNLVIRGIDVTKIDKLRKNQEFINASLSQTTSKKNVSLRLSKAKEILLDS